MAKQKDYYRQYAEKKAEREKRRSETWRAKLSDPLIIFTGILALSTAALTIVACLQLSALSSTDQATHDLAKAALEQIKAAERASTSGRAYLFVNYIMPQVPVLSQRKTLPPTSQVKIQYSIRNFGQTPGIITKFEPHLFVTKNGTPLWAPPDPASQELREQSRGIAAAPTFWIDPDFGTSRILIPAGADSGTIEQDFVFGNRETLNPRDTHGSWFYCALVYKDIFGFERHTFYYVGLFGAGATFPDNPEYNRWD